MFKAITTYLVGRKIVSFIGCAAMMIGLLAVCLVAYAFAPEAHADEKNPYVGKTYNLNNEEYGTSFHVFDDGTCMIRYTDNLRNGYSYNYNIGKNGELVVLSGEDTVFVATINDDGMLTDLDGNLWFPQD